MPTRDLYESKSWAFQKSWFCTLWCPYWNLDDMYLLQKKNTYQIIKTKTLRHLFHQRNNFHQKSVYPWRYFLSGRTLKLPSWKWKQKGCKSLSCGSMNKKFTGDVLLKKKALKVSQNPSTCNINKVAGHRDRFFAVNFKKF